MPRTGRSAGTRSPRGRRASARAGGGGDRTSPVAGQRRVPRRKPPGRRTVAVERLLGIETEYALGGGEGRGASARSGTVLDAIMRGARSQLATLPDELSRGVFLQNGARFYIDCGGH